MQTMEPFGCLMTIMFLCSEEPMLQFTNHTNMNNMKSNLKGDNRKQLDLTIRQRNKCFLWLKLFLIVSILELKNVNQLLKGSLVFLKPMEKIGLVKQCTLKSINQVLEPLVHLDTSSKLVIITSSQSQKREMILSLSSHLQLSSWSLLISDIPIPACQRFKVIKYQLPLFKDFNSNKIQLHF